MNDPLPNDETLLGFLLGALDDTETQWVLESIERHPHLRERLSSLADRLAPWMEELSSDEPIPSWLTNRVTMDIAMAESSGHSEPVDAESVSDADHIEPLSPVERVYENASEKRWLDVLIGSAACLILTSLLVPGVYTARKMAQRESCADNLQRLSHAFEGFSNLDAFHRIPVIELEGPRAFSGIYALTLHDRGLLESPRYLWCPSISPIPPNAMRLRSVEELQRLDPQTLACVQRKAGGSYAYNLGWVEEDCYVTPTWSGERHYAILADAPVIKANGEHWYTHGGEGINILFDDGHVAFLQFHRVLDAIDDPYHNRNGERAAGIDRYDHSLGSSHLAPLPAQPVSQRSRLLGSRP